MLLSVAGLQAGSTEHAFAVCFEGKLAEGLRQSGASVDLLPEIRLRSCLSVHRARCALARLLKNSHFDSVVCHAVWAYCVFAPTIRASGQDPVLYLHDVPEPRSAYYRWITLRPPRRCIANSEYTKTQVKVWNSRLRVSVVTPLVVPPAASPPESVRTLRSSWGVAPGELVILQASRLDPWKGHRVLLQSLARMNAVEGWSCWIAGSPQRPEEAKYQRELQRTVEVYGLSRRVRFIGHRDDMGTVLGASDIYCQPNESPEPYGIVFAEALAFGKPVVASKLGGVPEIVTPDCGLLCSRDPEQVARALTRLVLEPELLARMSAMASKRALDLLSPEVFEGRLAEALGGSGLYEAGTKARVG